MKSVNDIIELCDASLGPELYSNVARLGRKQENKIKPIRISFKNMDGNTNFFRNLGKLKYERNTDYKEILVAHDLTILERQQEKKLYEEVKRLSEESGGKDKFRTRGSPWDRIIVKVRN